MAKIQGDVLSGQHRHWEKTYTVNSEMFGEESSEPARKAAALFKQEEKSNILELGGGQGRDTIYFARSGFTVTTLDYAAEGVKAIADKAQRAGVSKSVTILCHDVRSPLPFPDATFDACYSHMLFCMALASAELELLAAEIRRVLKPGGINIYTVRHVGDPHYGNGIHRGEDMDEVGGFIVHFFSREMVEELARGYRLIGIDLLEEGPLPRKLFYVTLQKAPTSYTENVLDAPKDELVCWCSKVSKQTILQAIVAGANNLDDIRQMTRACILGRCKEFSPRGCCCSKEIIRLLEAAINDKEFLK